MSHITISEWFQSAATLRCHTKEKVAFIVLCQVDMILTSVAVSLGFTELNPFVVFLIEFPVMFIVIKGLVPLLIAWAVPGRLLLPSVAVLSFVLIWNTKELIYLLW